MDSWFGLVVAEESVDLEFFGGELGEHGLIVAAVGFGDEGSEFALAAFHVAVFEGVEGVLDLLGKGELGGAGGVGFELMVEGVGEEGAAGLVGSGVEGVGRDGGVGEGFEERGGG